MEDDLFQLRQLPVVKFRRTGESSRSDEDVISGEHEIQIEGVRTELEPIELEDGAAVPKEFANPTDDTFLVEDAVEAIGFGKFQWKLSVITGLAWMADAMEMMILSILAPQLHCGVCGNDVQLHPLGKHLRPVWQENRPEDQRLMDPLLWDPQWFRPGVQLDPGAAGPGGLWDWRSASVGNLVCRIPSNESQSKMHFTNRGEQCGCVPRGANSAVGYIHSILLTRNITRSCSQILLVQVFWAIGTVFEVLLAVVVMPTLGWRWLLVLSALPLLLFAVLCFWLPESARYDVLSGNQEKAIATLKRIATENGAPMPLGKLIVARQEDRGKMRDLFTPHFRWTTLLLWFIWFSNAFSYYGLVLLTTEFFQAGDVCSISSKRKEVKAKCSLTCEYLTEEDYTDLLWTTLSEFPGVLVTLWIIDRIGRKKTMALSFVVFSLCSLLLFLCVGRNVLTVLLFIARAFISGGFQAAYVYTPEVYPTATRALGLGTCSGMARVGALITPFIAQVMLESSVYLTLVVYSGCCLLAAVASCFLPIETKGRGLQESSQREWGQEMVGRGSQSPGVTRSNSGSQE
ncbi:synaptic vesicle 2-related protein isoform X1 [Pezoporus wallicus]|uniref:synaptic vesicle 2-related protein isoform X1 n=1 Tax=Pezoporus wallicus TaxID=35540 RepID=UPI0025500AFF|nr:synaptic vesicle 2-related protein isoform X1 [Pezoporus wallicus]XP_061322445.1 synaptic vesicle 2-related protein isoform X1 [Pezoporus flaviventris]